MIQAAFFDIDGTLVSFQTHAMPQSAVDALRALRERGVKRFLATGRNGDSTRFLMETGLFDGEILINGQYCCIDGKCIFENPICDADLEIAIAGAQNGEFTLGFLGGHTSFVSHINRYVLDACHYAGMAVPIVKNADYARRQAIHQIHCYGAPGVEDRLIARTSRLVSVRWSPNFADIYPADGGKELGMQAICEYLKLDRSATIAFGDGENDLSMLEWAGVGVAMGNASDSVKARADFITRSVDDRGLEFALKHFALI